MKEKRGCEEVNGVKKDKEKKKENGKDGIKRVTGRSMKERRRAMKMNGNWNEEKNINMEIF